MSRPCKFGLIPYGHSNGRWLATFIGDDSAAPVVEGERRRDWQTWPEAQRAPALLRPAPAGTFFTVNLLRRLNDSANVVRRFTQDPAGPFTNNLGE